MKLDKIKENTTKAPALVCSDNEVQDNCPVGCPSDYCPKHGHTNQLTCPKPTKCPPPACKCRPHYRRAENGTCIHTRDCPKGKTPITVGSTTLQSTTTTETTTQTTISNLTTPMCGDNEIVDSCPVECPSDYCPKNRYESQSSCPTPEVCPPPACKCGFNYRRDYNGTCIPTRDCPPFECNEKNEVYDPCPPYCPGPNCSQATPDGLCHIIGIIGIVLECEPACRCKPNYWRLNGKCVSYSECVSQNNVATTTTTMRSTSESSSDCEDPVSDICESNSDCQDKNNDSGESDCGCNEKDINVCECSRASDCACKKSKSTNSGNRHCIDVDRITCKSNDQIASDCGCDETDINVCECNRNVDCGCTNSKSIDSRSRNYQNKDTNSEESECGCDERDTNVCECSRTSDCSCKKSQCTDSSNKHCKNNDQIAPDCGCDETDISICECNYESDCGCKNSKSTDSNSRICNNKEENSNESGYGCDEPDNRNSDCGYEDTENYNPCDCDNEATIEVETQSDCGCKETDTFIPEEITKWKCCETDDGSEWYQDECSCETSQTPLICGDNEILDDCPVDCPSDYCPRSRYDDQSACPKPDVCPPPACKCRSNYKKAENGTCIPTEYCHLKCDGSNEKSDCVVACPPERTCRNRDIKFSCLHEKKCQIKCICKEGFIRNDNGICISENECDKTEPRQESVIGEPIQCAGQNEFYECGSACDNVCSQLHEQNRTNCPIVNVMCNRKCYCYDGYARNENNVCVPVYQCKNRSTKRNRQSREVQCTDPNEEYYKCKKTCPPELCFSIVARFKCDANEPCQSGCFCKPGYLRIKKNTPCVPICSCPEMSNSPDCE